MSVFGLDSGGGVHIPGTGITLGKNGIWKNITGVVAPDTAVARGAYGTEPKAASPYAGNRTLTVDDGNGNDLLSTPDISGGGGSSSNYTDTSAARGVTLGELGGLDEILARALAQAQAKYGSIIEGYNAEDAQNQKEYGQQVTTNEQTREAQHQASMLAAANGERGLFATLASIGALGGTGDILAHRAVANEANRDIGDANKAFDTNATTLFNSFSKLQQQEKQRRKDADAALAAEQSKSRYDVADTRQNLLKDLASLWTQAGNNSEAATALAKAGAQTSVKVANSPSASSVAGYATTPLQFQAPALKSYLAGANDMTVNVGSGNQLPINGALYTATKKRDELS